VIRPAVGSWGAGGRWRPRPPQGRAGYPVDVPDPRPRGRPGSTAASATAPRKPAGSLQSPPWVPALMVAMFLLGLAWLVVFYLAGTTLPLMSHLGSWNLLIGIAFIAVGFGVATQWR